MGDLDKEFNNLLREIEEGKRNFPTNEQAIIDSWVAKLSEPKSGPDEKTIRNDYSRALSRAVNRDKELFAPFGESPQDDELLPLPEGMCSAAPSRSRKHMFSLMKMPCSKPKPAKAEESGVIPKPRKQLGKPVNHNQFESTTNEFEDPEEMARILAVSKGCTFAEFVVAISRHTLDLGNALRKAMHVETNNFRKYVERILCQRIKDLTEVLDEEQNAELKRIKKDIYKWQLELSHCKKRIKDIIPDFDIDSHRRDRSYLKKMFTISTEEDNLEDDAYGDWKEESCHRLQWYNDMICKLAEGNDEIEQEINEVKADILELEEQRAKDHQNHVDYMNCALAEFNNLKYKLEHLNADNCNPPSDGE